MPRQKLTPSTDLEKLFLTEEQLALFTDRTDRWHRQLAQEEHIPPKQKQGWPLQPVLRGLIAYYRTLAERSKDGLRVEQECFTRAKRELAEEELLVFRKEKIERAKVGVALRNAHTQMRATLQQKFEAELGPKLPLLTPDAQLEAIRKAVDETCETFHVNLKDWY